MVDQQLLHALNLLPIKQLKHSDQYRALRGRSKLKTKMDIILAMLLAGENDRSTMSSSIVLGGQGFAETKKSSAPKTNKGKRWQQECKEWETKCPADVSLVGDRWCEHTIKSDLLRDPAYRFCFTKDELLSILHSAFTTLDDSYEVPQLRLTLPRDPYRRDVIPLDLLKHLKQRMTKKDKTMLVREYPEIDYLFDHLEEFGAQFASTRVPSLSPVNLSKELNSFFHRFKHPRGLRYQRVSNREIQWKYQ